jgi:hypothetical protein
MEHLDFTDFVSKVEEKTIGPQNIWAKFSGGLISGLLVSAQKEVESQSFRATIVNATVYSGSYVLKVSKAKINVSDVTRWGYPPQLEIAGTEGN